MNVREDPSASYKLLARNLEQKGYSVTETTELPIEVTFTSPSGVVWHTQGSHLAYPFNSDKAREVSIHKNLAYDLAESVGFPIPKTLVVREEASDRELTDMLQVYGQLIVKPLDSSLSHGLTINITSLPELRKAIAYAKLFSTEALVQEQVIGEEVRFTVIEGKVEAALLRRTARIIGDGHSSTAQLIAAENEARESLIFEHLTYPQLDASLVDSALLTSQKIPHKGEAVELNHSTMIWGGCSVYNVLPEVHESYINSVEELVASLKAGFVVVDVFCRAYKEASAPGNYWFIEFNTAPVLKLYYSCRDGKQFDIVPRLTSAIDIYLHRLKD